MASVLQSCKYLYTTRSVRNSISSLITFTTTQRVRTLYSPITLGIDAYVQQRARTDTQLGNISEKFRNKMTEFADNSSRNMIFTEDLKNMIHLANTGDVSLVIQMMHKFNEQNKQLRFGNFVFGPIVMRMFHYLKMPNEALECFNSPQLVSFFDQLISYQILLDLLYENNMYTEMLATFECIQSRQIEGTKYPRNIIVLTMAACYKLNTEESCKYALNLWSCLKDAGHFPMRRATTYCAALALYQNQPEACLEILVSSKNQNYTTVRNIKVLALAKIGRLHEAVNLMKAVLETEGNTKQTYNHDVVDAVKKAVEEESIDADLKQEMARIDKYFHEQGHISDGSLDAQLCEEIKPPPFLSNNRTMNRNFNSNQRFPNNYFNKHQRDGRGFASRQINQRRPGLNEMS